MQVLPRLFKLWPWVDLDLFYTKVKFGHIGFCMGKSENYLFFGNYCSLGSQSCLKHSAKWLNEVEYQRSRSFFDLVKGHSDLNVKTFFSQRQLGHLKPKLIWKLKGEWEWNFIQMRWVTWQSWPPCPYMVKMLKNLLQKQDQWPWNLVCSIVYASTIKVVQIMTLGWPWPILRQGQIWLHRLLYGRKWKLFVFFGNYCSLGSQSCLKHSAKWLNEVEWVSKVKVILWPCQRSLRFQS